MTQADRDRLVALKKAAKGLITRKQAAEELKVSERQVYRLLALLKEKKDKAVVHGLRGRPSNRKLSADLQTRAMEILKDPKFKGFGPTLAAERLADKHDIEVSKETMRRWMSQAGLWRPQAEKVRQVHVWRKRRERFGELVQWDTSEHDWLEGRGSVRYLIAFIDDATSRVFARFVESDSTEANMAVLREYLSRHGRPLEFYTDKASIFQTALKKNHREREDPLPPTQIGRALGELNIGWIAAHSPQAKGRVERSFQTAQDRLVKLLRLEGATTLEQANRVLEQQYLPQWQKSFSRVAACPDDAHRPLAAHHDLDAILSRVEQRVITSDYTFRLDGQTWQIEKSAIRPRMRDSKIRVEHRHDGTLAARFEDTYLTLKKCDPAPPAEPKPRSLKAANGKGKGHNAGGKSKWMQGFLDKVPTLGKALSIANATS